MTLIMHRTQSDNYRKNSKDLDSPSSIDKNVHFATVLGEVEAKQRFLLVQWLSGLVPTLNLSINITDDELRARLSNGTILCQIMNKLRPGSVNVVSESDRSLPSQSENLKAFLKAVGRLGLPRFDISELEKGSVKGVVDCLLSLRAKYLHNNNNNNNNNDYRECNPNNTASPRGYAGLYSPTYGAKKFHRVSSSPALADSPSDQSHSLIYKVGYNFQEVFQPKNGSYVDLPPAKISEMMKSVSLGNAPTQSLLSVVNDILEESVERRNGEIPNRVACLLRKVSQEIERRMSTQAEHLRTQNNLFKIREQKYHSRLRVLEALACGTRLNDSEMMMASPLAQLKSVFNKDECKKGDDEDVSILKKEKEEKDMEISALKQQLEMTKRTCEMQCSQLEEYKHQLQVLRNKVKELEASSVSKCHKWNMEKNHLQSVVNSQFSSLQKLKSSWESIKQDARKQQQFYEEECNRLGVNLKSLALAAESCQVVIAENKKLFNEIQDLKGNIRVYCRIRPYLPGETETQSVVEQLGEDNLVVAGPSRQGKEAPRSFKFNKVFGPLSTQVDVYSDIQLYVRSVLEGYNVCIFAYGQTGSGKTYTMTGPNGATEENIGVNYRALNDLFKISTSRKKSVVYEIGVQMVEIYNEQVRDLLSNQSSSKRLGILTHSQQNGIAVPDANMFPVESSSDVVKLMEIGLKNRAVGTTAMNERSSRSHSVVSIHVRGKDLVSGSTLHGNLHLVDLAGSERVDRSEVTGDRLREAQHINKSLSALGDVIFALSQKSSHIPYRNSKLTQLLQTSLGGQAKTLMFVQLNSDQTSFSETASTLKFAERVSGVELGAARSSKDNKEVKELMEQVASMKNIILKKDEEIERLESLKGSIGGSFKHRNSLLRQSESPVRSNSRRINNVANAETLSTATANADFDKRVSDRSQNGHVGGPEADGSGEKSVPTQGPKSSNKTTKTKAIPKIVQGMRKLGQTSSLVAKIKDSPKMSPGIKRSTSNEQLKRNGSSKLSTR